MKPKNLLQKTVVFLLLCVLSASLFAQAPPVITSFSPASGPVGTSVIITGNNFSSTTKGNKVSFGAVRAVVTVATTTSLTVTVPAGTSYAPISVLNNTTRLTAYTNNPFNVTFDGGKIGAGSFEKESMINGYPFYQISIADLDIDGKPDMIVNFNNSSIAAYRNISTDSLIVFAPEIIFPVNGGIRNFTLSDLNGDAKPDIAVINFYTGIVSVLENNSSAGIIDFKKKMEFKASDSAFDLAIGDFNSDGKPDIAITGSTNISILKNTSISGVISFDSTVTSVIAAHPSKVASGDFDGDGKPDLAVTSRLNGPISVLTNTGTGTTISFALPVDFATGITNPAITLGDLNNDGKPDIALSGNNFAAVLENKSIMGALDFNTKIELMIASPAGSNIAIADMDGDSKPDMVLSNYENGLSTQAVLKNQSSASTIIFAAKVNYAASGGYKAIGDLQGDGKPDIALSWQVISTLRNKCNEPIITSFLPGAVNGPGKTVTIKGTNFTGATAISFGGIAAASYSVVSDSIITSVTGTGASGTVVVTTSKGTGTLKGFIYTPNTFISAFSPTMASTGSVVAIQGVNFTGTTSVRFGGMVASSFTVKSDTLINATVALGASGNVEVTSPKGTSSLAGFDYVSIAITSFAPTSGPVGGKVIIMGLNFNPVASGNIVYFGAVKAQVLAASAGSLTVAVPAGATYEPITVLNTANSSIAYSSAPFDITFPTANDSGFNAGTFAEHIDFATGSTPSNIFISDLDGDGKPDMIAGLNSGIGIFRNTSMGKIISFAPQIIATPQIPVFATAGDIDCDGKPDIVMIKGSSSTKTISVFRNTSSTGNISFAPGVEYQTKPGAFSIIIRDIDADGKPDMTVINNSTFYPSDGVGIYKNSSTVGIIAFENYLRVWGEGLYPNHPLAAAIADIDGDSKPDLIISYYLCGDNWCLNHLSIIYNISVKDSIQFGGGYTIENQLTYTPSGLSVADMDNDGKQDIALITSETGLSIFKNMSMPGNFYIYKTIETDSLYTHYISIADLNGDGKPDIGTGNSLKKGVSLFKNNSSTGIISLNKKVDYVISKEPISIAVADLDGDGKPDIATANYTEDISVLRNLLTCLPPLKITYKGNLDICVRDTVVLIADSLVGVRYQWFRNGTKINGAITYYYIATDTGRYTVLVYKNKQCTAFSDTVKVTKSCVITAKDKEEITAADILFTKISIAPNPSKGNITVAYNSSVSGAIQLNIFDITGKKLFTKSVQAVAGNNTYQLNLAGLAAGVYNLRLNTGSIQQQLRFVVEN